MKKSFSLALGAFFMLLLTSCHVHEWPEGDITQFTVNLIFETEFERIDFPYTSRDIENSRSRFYTTDLTEGIIEYKVRAFPLANGEIVDRNYYQEYTFTRDIKDGYNCNFLVDLDQGNYRLIVWAMLAESAQGPFYYNASNFWKVSLVGEYSGDNNYRDAFKGMMDIEVGNSLSTTVQMTRPLAKWEFVATDVPAFTYKES